MRPALTSAIRGLVILLILLCVDPVYAAPGQPRVTGVVFALGPGMRGDARIDAFLHSKIAALFPKDKMTVELVDNSMVASEYRNQGAGLDVPTAELCRIGRARAYDYVLLLSFRPLYFHTCNDFMGQSILVDMQLTARMVAVSDAQVTCDKTIKAQGREHVLMGLVSERAALRDGTRNLWNRFAFDFKPTL